MDLLKVYLLLDNFKCQESAEHCKIRRQGFEGSDLLAIVLRFEGASESVMTQVWLFFLIRRSSRIKWVFHDISSPEQFDYFLDMCNSIWGGAAFGTRYLDHLHLREVTNVWRFAHGRKFC